MLTVSCWQCHVDSVMTHVDSVMTHVDSVMTHVDSVMQSVVLTVSRVCHHRRAWSRTRPEMTSRPQPPLTHRSAAQTSSQWTSNRSKVIGHYRRQLCWEHRQSTRPCNDAVIIVAHITVHGDCSNLNRLTQFSTLWCVKNTSEIL